MTIFKDSHHFSRTLGSLWWQSLRTAITSAELWAVFDDNLSRQPSLQQNFRQCLITMFNDSAFFERTLRGRFREKQHKPNQPTRTNQKVRLKRAPALIACQEIYPVSQYISAACNQWSTIHRQQWLLWWFLHPVSFSWFCENHVRRLRTFFTVVLEPNIHTLSVLSETLPDFLKSKLC